MAGFDRDEGSAAGGRDLAVGRDGGFDDGAVFRGLDDARREVKHAARGSWPAEFDGVVGRDGAGRVFEAVLAHEVIGCRPVRVAVEERARDAAVEHAGEGLVVRLGSPIAHDLVAVSGGEATDAQPLLVRGAAAEARVVRRVLFLKTQHRN